MRPGDWLVLTVAACALLALTDRLWLASGKPQSVVVRSGGQHAQEYSLATNAIYTFVGPLGLSEVEVRDGRVRIAKDPSPKQYCVKQGWLARPGEAALCLPNRISIQIAGGRSFDSLNF